VSGGGGVMRADLGSSNKKTICVVDEGSPVAGGEATVDTEMLSE